MYQQFFADTLNKIKQENRYRKFIAVQKNHTCYPYVIHNGKEVALWCSNDYMAMSQNPAIINAAIKKTQQCGVGSGGTRNISGSSREIIELEECLAKHHKQERALVFTSGYIANQSTIATLGKIIPNLIIFSDQFNHASIISGIKQSGCDKHIFRHNDLQHLEELLQSYPINQPKIIIFESIYSMHGDIAPVVEICKLAKKYNCMTYIDEVHTVGIFGKKGAGITEQLNLQDQITIIQGTLAKAYGCIGGYITGSDLLIDAIRSTASDFIFTTSLPPMIAYAAKTSIEFLQNNLELRQNYLQKMDNLRKKIKNAGLPIMSDANFHILPILVQDSELCTNIAQKLLNNFEIYIQAINFPTVPRGSELLRITASVLHSEGMIENLIYALNSVFLESKVEILETV